MLQAVHVLRRVIGREELAALQERVRQDLLVYLALDRFAGRPRFGELPEALRVEIAEKQAIPKKTATQVLDQLAEMAYKNAKNSFTIPGVGKLVLVHRKARKGRNPATGEPIKIPAKKVLKFRVAKACKDAVLGSKKK
jgi:DNA-binding protein HU-beta